MENERHPEYFRIKDFIPVRGYKSYKNRNKDAKTTEPYMQEILDCFITDRKYALKIYNGIVLGIAVLSSGAGIAAGLEFFLKR